MRIKENTMDNIPTSDECIELLKQVGCSEKVINHCKAVRDLAIKIAELAGADIKLVEAGALLHDIGRSKTHGNNHAVEGVKIAKKLKLPLEIINIIQRHLGAGLTEEEAKKLKLPKWDFIPRTLEEKIVCHADNLINKNQKQPIEEEVEHALKKGLNDYVIRLVKLHKELSEKCGIDLNDV